VGTVIPAFQAVPATLGKCKHLLSLAKLVVEQIDDYDGPNKIKRAYKLVNVTKTPIKRNSLQAGREIDVLDIRVHDLYKLVKMHDKSFNPKAGNPAMLEPDGKPKRF